MDLRVKRKNNIGLINLNRLAKKKTHSFKTSEGCFSKTECGYTLEELFDCIEGPHENGMAVSFPFKPGSIVYVVKAGGRIVKHTIVFIEISISETVLRGEMSNFICYAEDLNRKPKDNEDFYTLNEKEALKISEERKEKRNEERKPKKD